MTRRAQLVVLAVLLLLLALAFIAPPTRSDAPVTATAVPAGEFVPVMARQGGALTPAADRLNPEPGATGPQACGPAPVLAVVCQPARFTPSLRPRVAAVREAPSSHSASVTGQSAIGTALVAGIASTYGPGFDGYLALPSGPGHRVRVCGAAGCVERVSNDTGPDLAMQRLGRVVDLSVADFEAVSGQPWRVGLTRVTVEFMTP